ncbi:uncharacterized protein EI90DRAFT_3020955 [Cantharellus anzutake]|uniref:uncharacterized protein n=1 Tax=Cantharellus anzutake TaxID=1750568 RepID=UPI0019069E21|nr:uncharacterized protein EI90DRAFT_3020955 [Cantharellus anzutake]KAF8318572.1 hypothetical protein EI90DRAFT_3020955 [Cantharellus anzutake]
MYYTMLCPTIPLLFHYLCINRANRQPWDVLSIAKGCIVEFLESSPPAPVGVCLAALKFAQHVILVQTRGVSDPQLQNKADPNVSLIPSDHPFINAIALEAEGTQLLTLITTILDSSSDSDSVSTVINSFGTLAKAHPQLLQFIIEATSKWSPAKLAGQSTIKIRSAEKSIFILLNYLLKYALRSDFVVKLKSLRMCSCRLALERISEHIKQIIHAEYGRQRLWQKQNVDEEGCIDAFRILHPKRIKLELSGPDTSSAVSALANFNFQDSSTELVTAKSSHATVATSKPSTEEAPWKSDVDDEEMYSDIASLTRAGRVLSTQSAEVLQVAQTIDDSAEADELALQLQSTAFDPPLPQELDIIQAESFIRSARFISQRLLELGASNDGLLRPIPSDKMWILLFVQTVMHGQRSSIGTLATGDLGTQGRDKQDSAVD